jgi:uncharacterized protein (DUF924 family)
MTPDDMVKFWMAAGEERWFSRDATFDAQLAIRFGAALAAAREGALDHWGDTPQGALGLVLLLDQVSRNINRGSPLAFAADRKALALVKQWVGRGYHWKVPAPQAMWFCLPFEHSENIDDQWRCVGLFQTLGLNDMVYWGMVHLKVIAKFGRFPHRNAVLGRTSTSAEIAFLKSGGFSA